MDAGDRWTLNDAAGKPMFAWDSRGAMLLSSYDALHRPNKLELKNPDHSDWIVVGLTQYGEGATGDKSNNRRGRPYRSFDQSGVVTNQEFDFNGNALNVTRRLANDYDQDTDWRTVLQLPLDQEPVNLLMPETFTQTTEYDALNRMTRQYSWHRAGGAAAAVYEPTYNARGLLESEDLTVSATQTQAIKNIQYNEKGQRLQIRYGNEVATNYTYDPETFRLLTLVSTRPSNPILQNLSYTYDPGGNITEVFDAAVPTEFFNGAVIEPRKRYVYDALYRLIEATGREHAGQLNFGALDNWNDCPYRVDYGANNSKAWRNYIQRYAYDSVGNILVMNHIAIADSANSWTRQYQYATDSNRLLSTGMSAEPANRYATSPTLDYRYGYNAHGSMTSMPHLPTMDWDYTERLRYISRAPASQSSDPDDCPNSSLEAWYRYDASKQRTRKRVVKQGGIVEERFYLGGLEWYRRIRNGALKEEIETLHLFDGEQRLLMVDQVIETDRPELGKRNLYRYTLGNHLGSSIVELDENADVISYEEYHPYGATAYQSGSNAAEVKLKRYRYTGMERDEESGLNYHWARYYALWLGRWTSNDQNKLVDGPNLYSLVKDNPINQIDTNGNQSGPDVFRQLPPWLQAKIMRGEVNDQVSNAIHTAKLQQFKNVQPRREATWEDHVLNIMTLGGWSIGWTGAGNYDAVSSSPALSDLNPFIKGAMAAGMTAGDVTGTRNIVEGLREKDTLNTRTLSADESFDKVVSGTITAGTVVLTEVGLRNLSTTNFGLKGKPLVTNTMKMASPALSAEEAAVRARINELEKQLEKVLADDPGKRNVIVDALLEHGQINEGVVAELARAKDKTGAIRALRRAIEGSDVRAARQLQGESALRELESARAQVPDLRRQARANPPRWMLE